MTAELLRRAASLMRERAEAATPGPWEARHGLLDPVIVQAGSNWPHAHTSTHAMPDAEYIAGMDPVVAVAVADCLDAEAAIWEKLLEIHASITPAGMKISWGESTSAQAMAVASAFLREPS